MDIFAATMIAEGCFELAGNSDDEITEELQVEAWQLLIDTGTCWRLQGSFGRQAAALIDAGICERASA
jgi:hypothetical protein